MSKKTIDLFSGCGGLSYGFFQNGFDIVESVEHWQPALDTYNLNYNKNEKIKDITDPKVIKSIEERFKNTIDLVIGGFPCQGYSMVPEKEIQMIIEINFINILLKSLKELIQDYSF
ncbi:DNA cytosine methyltransferase [Mycoplasmopsis cynos]|uniref:DNA cytosine methyltransferase n=1 Tax=Mycoplasmopsis cynos TaxID=171284 RepID=UPI0024CAB478|nr:DNA cytosine methyltransferase [Mycoplasmopsis cynos]WAM03202.1 DNA cytosine methyltransferase [Mycoplasmopsis cynos]